MASIPEPHPLSSPRSSSMQSPTEFQVSVGGNLYTFEVISTASDGKTRSLSVNSQNQIQIDRIQEIATAILTAHLSTSPDSKKLQQIKRIDSRGVKFRDGTCINHSQIGLGQAGAKAILQAREGIISDGLTAYQRELIKYHMSLPTDTSNLSKIDFDEQFPNLSPLAGFKESFQDKGKMSKMFESLSQDNIDERSLHMVNQGEKNPLQQPPSLTEETTFATIFKSYNERFVGNQTLDKAWGALAEKVHSLVQGLQASYTPTIDIYQGSFKQKVNTCSANAVAFVEAALTNGLGKVQPQEELDEVLATGEGYYTQTDKMKADHLQSQAQLPEQAESASAVLDIDQAEGSQMLAVDDVFNAVETNTNLGKINFDMPPQNTPPVSYENHKESCLTLFTQLKSLSQEKAGFTITCNNKTYAVIRDGSTYAIYDSHGAPPEAHNAYVKTTWDLETAAHLLSDLTYVKDTPNNMNIVCFVKKESSE